MPFSEFQPGTAGLALPEFQSSLMQRAQAMRVQREQLEIEKQKLAASLTLNDEHVKAQRLQLAEWEGQKHVRAMQGDAALAEARTRYQNLSAGETALASAASDVPALTARLEAESNPDAFHQQAADFIDRYALIAGSPNFGLRFDQLTAPIVQLVKNKTLAFQQRYAAAAEGFRPALASGDPEKLAAIEQSGYFNIALRDPQFLADYRAAKSALRTAPREPVVRHHADAIDGLLLEGRSSLGSSLIQPPRPPSVSPKPAPSTVSSSAAGTAPAGTRQIARSPEDAAALAREFQKRASR